MPPGPQTPLRRPGNASFFKTGNGNYGNQMVELTMVTSFLGSGCYGYTMVVE